MAKRIGNNWCLKPINQKKKTGHKVRMGMSSLPTEEYATTKQKDMHRLATVNKSN